MPFSSPIHTCVVKKSFATKFYSQFYRNMALDKNNGVYRRSYLPNCLEHFVQHLHKLKRAGHPLQPKCQHTRILGNKKKNTIFAYGILIFYFDNYRHGVMITNPQSLLSNPKLTSSSSVFILFLFFIFHNFQLGR